MIYLYEDESNNVAEVCTRNKTLPDPFFMWSMTHKLSGQVFNFIPHEFAWDTDYPPGYNYFNIGIFPNQAQSLTGNSISGITNVHLIPGEYDVKVYEQESWDNINPKLAYAVVANDLCQVIGTNQNTPTTYSGTSDVFIIYNEYNE